MTLTLPNRPRRAAASLLMSLALAAAGTAQGADGWDEAVNGDFSGDGLLPSFVSLSAGTQTILGTTGRAVAGGPVDRDYFTLTVPAGHVLESIILLAGTVVILDGSFIGVMAGSTFTVPPDAQSAAGLLGWTLFGENQIGEDLLNFMATPSFGSTGFTPPLPAGSYAFWVQETGVGTATYRLALTVSAIPEAPTALSMLGGLVLLSAALRRR